MGQLKFRACASSGCKFVRRKFGLRPPQNLGPSIRLVLFGLEAKRISSGHF
jgi:hypothetical protein